MPIMQRPAAGPGEQILARIKADRRRKATLNGLLQG
jgi:hypothetical protein